MSGSNGAIGRVCGIEGCDEKHYGSGLCKRHYARAKYQRYLAERIPFGRFDPPAPTPRNEDHWQALLASRAAIRHAARHNDPACPRCAEGVALLERIVGFGPAEGRSAA